MASSTDILKILLNGSLTLSAILFAMLGFLWGAYQSVQAGPSPNPATLRIYRLVIWIMVSILVVDSVSIFTCLSNLLSWADLKIALIVLFTIVTAGIPIIAIFVSRFVTR
jgi:hypothetical protein